MSTQTQLRGDGVSVHHRTIAKATSDSPGIGQSKIKSLHLLRSKDDGHQLYEEK